MNMNRPPLCCFATTVLVLSATAVVAAANEPRLEYVGKKVFVATPKRGVNLKAWSYYTQPTGLELYCRFSHQTRSDSIEASFEKYSPDNGRTWSEPVAVPVKKKVAGGTLRFGERPGFVDPDNGALVVFGGSVLLPNDHPLEAQTRGRPGYRLSRDGGRTFYHEAKVVHVGDEFNEDHPLPGVWFGKNAIQVGDLGCRMIKLRNGDLLQPVQVSLLDADGKPYNPGGGYTYHSAAVLLATWNKQGTLDWRMSDYVKGDPKLSTRGMLEPTVAEFADGRLLMVLRGSNDTHGKIKGYRWHTVSSDGGKTWSESTPWKYSSGESFYSPSSCSTLINHSSGAVVWIGNIAPTNPRANYPRHPLVAGVVDPESLQLIKESIVQIDTLQPDDHPLTTFSNFYVREDRETKELLVYCPPIGQKHPLSLNDPKRTREWTADTIEYRVAVKAAK